MREIFRREIRCERVGQNGPFYTTFIFDHVPLLVYYSFINLNPSRLYIKSLDWN